jgi:hypothetical protein
MTGNDLTKFIVRERGKRRSRNDIIVSVCERSGMQWRAAERFVIQVLDEYRDKVTGRYDRLILVIGIATIVGGLWFSAAMVYATLEGLDIGYGFYVGFIPIPIPYVGNLALIGLGLLAAAGGAAGILWLGGLGEDR